jgi:release factor glutamine methyltransferase
MITLKEAIKRLEEAGIPSPDYDARELFRAFANLGSTPLTQGAASDSDELLRAIERRVAREPLQYIVGSVGFYREEYKVTPDCLIPRSDTEILVDYAVKNIPCGERFADLCSGSGCIGISTLKNTKDTLCDSFDISDGALALTRENAALNCVDGRITVTKKDLLGEEVEGEYFAILSNPPYIPKEVYEGLDREIFSEPEIAFVGGEDGLGFYKKITALWRDVIDDRGFIAFEIGYDQRDALILIAEKNLMNIEILKDLGGNDRVAVLRKK